MMTSGVLMRPWSLTSADDLVSAGNLVPAKLEWKVAPKQEVDAPEPEVVPEEQGLLFYPGTSDSRVAPGWAMEGDPQLDLQDTRKTTSPGTSSKTKSPSQDSIEMTIGGSFKGQESRSAIIVTQHAFATRVGASFNILLATQEAGGPSSVPSRLLCLFARQRVDQASDEDSVVAALGLAGEQDVAKRIVQLIKYRRDEPDDDPMNLESLRSAARFVLSERRFKDPMISLTGDGRLCFDWSLHPDGLSALVFRKDGQVTFAALGPTNADGQREVELEGIAGPTEVFQVLEPLKKWLQS